MSRRNEILIKEDLDLPLACPRLRNSLIRGIKKLIAIIQRLDYLRLRVGT